MKVVPSTSGAQLVDGGDVLSDVRSTPGPTHTLFDVIAAAVAAVARGPRVAVLGFAAGGLMAPLRAMPVRANVDGVDLDAKSYELFEELCGTWAGRLRWKQDDAVDWLARRRVGYDVILEDLSVAGRGGHVKPEVSRDVLPELIERRLNDDGTEVFNLLPPDDETMSSLVHDIVAPFRSAYEIRFTDYDNRLILAGRELPSTRQTARRMRELLDGITSRQRNRFALAKTRRR